MNKQAAVVKVDNMWVVFMYANGTQVDAEQRWTKAAAEALAAAWMS